MLDDQGKVFTGFPVQIGETIRHLRAAQSLLRSVSQLRDTTVRALVGALVGALGGVLVDGLLGSNVSAVVDSDLHVSARWWSAPVWQWHKSLSR